MTFVLTLYDIIHLAIWRYALIIGAYKQTGANEMNAIKAIYARYYWMTKFALVEDDGENSQKLFDCGFRHGVRMEQLYGDIFADVREQVGSHFVFLGNGRWACKFLS